MSLLRECLSKVLRTLNLPFKGLRDIGDAVEAVLSQQLSASFVFDRVNGDIRFKRGIELTSRGFFLHIKNQTIPGISVRAQVAIKFFSRDDRILKITAVVHKAQVYMSNGDVETAYSVAEMNKLIRLDIESTRFDKEIRSVG